MSNNNTTEKKPVPFVLTGQALQSLRDSGYTIEAALGEVIDNSIEADANNIYIYLFKKENKKGKKQVHEIAIVDDGKGMNDDILQHYPQIGFSTRYMRDDTIGKYGVGAKLAALNFGKCFEVWSRDSIEVKWKHVYLDLEDMLENEEAGEQYYIPEPKSKDIPEGWTDSIKGKVGTVVLWSKVDRLEEGRHAISYDELESNLEKELSRIFRYFINGGIKIYVNDKPLLAYDPLFIMNDSFADKILKEQYIRVGPAEKIKDHYPARLIAEETIKIGPATAALRVTLYPREMTRQRFMGGDELAKKARVVENEGSISFVRKNREVSYTNVPRIFPRGVQEADRFIGIEVSFNPPLDSYFGVRNVKRGVEPHGELRAIIRNHLSKYLKIARKLLDQDWGDAEREHQEKYGEHNTVLKAAKAANETMPKGKAKGPESKAEENKVLNELAFDVVGNDESKKETYLNNIKDLPFVIESVNFPGTQFIDITHLSNKVIIRLNTRHRFYQEMWQPIKSISQQDPNNISADEVISISKRTIEALTLLLITYGKAESMDENPDEKYRDLTNYWGQFLYTMMGKVKDIA
ncbi:MAG TPA: ATP-binding protein [Puia sp.]|jgi:hypothetical protein|nr:ATP-binding protein [Puia sp.]